MGFNQLCTEESRGYNSNKLSIKKKKWKCFNGFSTHKHNKPKEDPISYETHLEISSQMKTKSQKPKNLGIAFNKKNLDLSSKKLSLSKSLNRCNKNPKIRLYERESNLVRFGLHKVRNVIKKWIQRNPRIFIKWGTFNYRRPEIHVEISSQVQNKKPKKNKGKLEIKYILSVYLVIYIF